LPVVRFTHIVIKSSPSEAVRKMRSPVTIGDEFPTGSGIFHRTFFWGPNSVSSCPQEAHIPEAFGPRN
jgi:hypothetical protein